MMRMEEKVDECHQGLEYETPVWRTEAAEDQKFHTINFCFSCNPVYIYQPSDDSMSFEELPTITKSIRVNLEDFNNWEGACENLDGLLVDYPMNYDLCEELMKFAVDTAKGILFSSGHHVLDLDITFEICHEHFFEENNATAMAGIGYNSASVSAKADSILTRCLKCKVISSFDDHVRCTICLEDIYEGLCLPCSHVFHGDCIETWLRTDRSCPLCRFELPTS